MRWSFLLFLLLLSASLGTTPIGTGVQKVEQVSEEEPDPCSDPMSTTNCARIRIPVG